MAFTLRASLWLFKSARKDTTPAQATHPEISGIEPGTSCLFMPPTDKNRHGGLHVVGRRQAQT